MKYYTLEEKLTKMTFKDYLDEMKETLIEDKGIEWYERGLNRYLNSMEMVKNVENEYSFLEFINLLGRGYRWKNNIEYLKYYGFDKE